VAAVQDDEELSGEGEWSDLVQRRYRRMMVLAVSLPLLQQASGINSITFYSSSVSCPGMLPVLLMQSERICTTCLQHVRLLCVHPTHCM
jgi:hypothetical protein